MNETELEAKLKDLGIKFTASTFKPNAQEISVYEQLINAIYEHQKKISELVEELTDAEKPRAEAGPLPGGVVLKPVHPDFLQPLRHF